MNQPLRSPTRASLAAALVAALFAPAAWAAFDSGSTGADGALNPATSMEIQLPPSGILNYTTINIPTGVTVKFKRNAANTPAYILASGDVTIAGSIDVSGADSAATGTYGDGAQSDDGSPGHGGPGGFDGGRGGRNDSAQRAAIIRGGAGLGPGGGPGAVEGDEGCSNLGYYKQRGVGGGYSADALVSYLCGGLTSARTGLAYGSELLQPMVGGSGGGGGRGGTNYPGSGGGGGGGAALIAASGVLKVTGTINARGGDGGGVAGTGAVGNGAGGSGGAIRLVATRVEGNGSLLAEGGCINYNNSRRQYCGYTGGSNHIGGSPGRIRIEGESITFNGTSQPTAVRGDTGPVFIANAPGLRIASVAGQAVAAVPTGSNDVNLPASTTGPVVVAFETTNVPVGNTVSLRIVPASGTPSETISPAIVGSTAAGTAQISVVLPQGSSTLQATTTYTVVVAALEDEALREKLSRLAQNERVEKVEVTVALEGGARARLITGSGRSFDLPYEALSAIGFKG